MTDYKYLQVHTCCFSENQMFARLQKIRLFKLLSLVLTALGLICWEGDEDILKYSLSSPWDKRGMFTEWSD